MKKIFLMAVTAAAVMFTSCSKDNNGGDDFQKSGEPVFAQFSIKLPANETRASITDSRGVGHENTINDVTVYIFGAQGSNYILEAMPAITVGATTSNTYSSQVVQITTGLKKVFAVANKGANRLAALTITPGVTPLSNFQNALLLDVATADNDGVDMLFTSSETSVNVVDRGAVGGAATSASDPFKFTINVKRAVAKIIARDNISVATALDASVVSNSPQFAINGLTGNSFLFQATTLANPTGVLHNWWNTDLPTADPNKAKKITPYTAIPASGTSTNTIKGDGSNGGWYVLENIAPSTVNYGKSTMIYVKLQLVPNTTFTTSANAAGASIQTGDTYYKVDKTDGSSSLFFASEADFNTWVANGHDAGGLYAAAGTLYTNGWNYYVVKITHDISDSANKYSIVRGNIYCVDLGVVKAFGRNTDDDIVDPTDPVETQAFIEATVNVMNWVINYQNSDLE